MSRKKCIWWWLWDWRCRSCLKMYTWHPMTNADQRSIVYTHQSLKGKWVKVARNTGGEIAKRAGREELKADSVYIDRIIFSREHFWVSFFSPASIQQIGKLIRLRLVHADKRLDGYTIEIKRITRSTDRGVGLLRLPLPLLSRALL